MIKHLIIPGGAIYGFAFYGALKELIKNGTIDVKEIKTIHATSVGCILSVLLCLQYDWDEVDKYLIHRPWHHLFKFSLHSILSCFSNNGLFTMEIIKEMLLPLFNAKGISIDISMNDFYELYGIELHFFSIDLKSFTVIDVSHKTFPTWTIIEAIYSSSCAPILFQPFCKDDKIYVDGGLLVNCPLKELIENTTIQPSLDEIFYINTSMDDEKGDGVGDGDGNDDGDGNEGKIIETESKSLINYILLLFTKMVRHYSKTKSYNQDIKHILIIQDKNPAFDIYSIVNSPEQRSRLIQYGIDCVKKDKKILQKPPDAIFS